MQIGRQGDQVGHNGPRQAETGHRAVIKALAEDVVPAVDHAHAAAPDLCVKAIALLSRQRLGLQTRRLRYPDRASIART